MGYILEKVDAKDWEKILSDAVGSDRKYKHLLMRGGHFSNSPGLSRAINKDNGSYLFIAPKLNVMSQERRYYFYYHGNMYLILMSSEAAGIVSIEDDVSGVNIDELKSEIRLAFLAHGYSGRDHEKSLEVSFQGE